MADEKRIITEVNEAVSQLTSTFKVLQEVVNTNLTQQEQLIAYMDKLKKAIGSSKELKDFVKVSNELQKTQETLSKTQQAALKIQSEQEKLRQQELKTQQATANALKTEEQRKQSLIRTEEASARQKARLNKEAEKAARASQNAASAYQRESARLLQLTKSAKDAAIQYGVNSKQAKVLMVEQQKLDKTIKQVDSSLGIHNRNVGNYGGALGNLTGKIMGAFGFVGGITMAANAIRKMSQELDKNAQIQNKLRQQYDLTNKELKDISKQVQIISNVYDKDYNEVIQSANALSKEFGLTAEESLGLIQEGFEKGADNSGEFLAMLREYPAQLKTVGLNAEQSIAIMTQAVQEGVFSDKGVDAIKEAGIRLRELTPATREALNAIGLSSDEIEKALRSGTKSMFDVIQDVSRQLKTLPPASKEVGMALADIFGGPGEDAGIRYISMLGDVSMSLDDVKDKTDPYVKSQRDLTEEWTKTMLGMQGANGIATEFNKMLTTILQKLNSIFGERTFDVDFSDFTGSVRGMTTDQLEWEKKTLEKHIETTNKVYDEGMLVRAASLNTFARKAAFLLKPDQYDILPGNFSGNMLTYLNNMQTEYETLVDVKGRLSIVNKALNGELEDESELTNLINGLNEDEGAETDLIKIQEKLLKAAKEVPATIEEEIIIRARKIKIIETEIERLKAIGDNENDLIKIQEILLKKAREMSGATELDIKIRNRRVIAIEAEIARLKELGEIKQVEKMDTDAILKNAQESFDALQELDQQEIDAYLDKEKQKLDIFEDFAKQRLELERDVQKKAEEFAQASVNAIFEVQAQRYEDDLEANSKYYDDLLANEQLDEEQRSLLEAQRLEKENEIKAQQRENEKKQFLFNQGFKVAEIWMDSFQKIAAIKATASVLASNPLTMAFAPMALAQIPMVKLSAGLAVGTVLAQSIPQFFKGTDNAPEGVAWVGEKGTEMKITPDGKASLTPGKPTLDYLEKGTKIIPHNELMDAINNYSTASIINEGSPVSNTDAIIAAALLELKKENKNNNDKLLKALSNKPQTVDKSIDRMRKNALQNKLKGKNLYS
jgi:hypothetical protein